MDPITATTLVEGAAAAAMLLPILIGSAVIIVVWKLLDWLWDTLTGYIEESGIKFYNITV